MKIRWSNGYSFQIEFYTNDPDEFYQNSMSALRSFRIATEKRVHRGEIRKTVSRFESCELGVYDDSSHQWYMPEGEPGKPIETKNFGDLRINRYFRVVAWNAESDTLDAALAEYKIMLICIDPGGVSELDLSHTDDSNRIWNLCIGSYQHAQNIQNWLGTLGQDLLNSLE